MWSIIAKLPPPQVGASLKGIVSGGGNFAIMDHTPSSQQGSLTLDGHDVDFALIEKAFHR